jgi:peptide/nickel transport system substrate-binding protein
MHPASLRTIASANSAPLRSLRENREEAMRYTALGVLLFAGTIGSAAAQSVIRYVPHADLKVVDPITNTAAITNQHATMVYDMLFAYDRDYRPQPQMVETWSASPDGLTYRFVLRPGLKFHDGQPVKAADAVASIARWAARDSNGGILRGLGMQLAVVDDRTFTLSIKEPWGLVLDSLAKDGSYAAFVMREKEAKTDPNTPITEVIGSGPFRFSREGWVPGSKVVYVKDAGYVPRAEPASLFAGGKVVRVDRVEWTIIPDAATAANALNAGEVDIFEQPPTDLLPLLRRNRDVVVKVTNPFGEVAYLRPNHLHPPFDKPEGRQALLYIASQDDYMTASAGDPANWRRCFSWLGCGSSNETEAGTADFQKPNLAKAKELLQKAGYAGQPVVVLQPNDLQVLRDITEVMVARLRQAGVTVDLQLSDWATLTARRAKKDPPDKGGWSLFVSTAFGFRFSSPVTNFALPMPCGGTGFFGWACDETMNGLLAAWAKETDPAKRKATTEKIQLRAIETMPYMPMGQIFRPIAYRSNIEGLIEVPSPVLWNVAKR